MLRPLSGEVTIRLARVSGLGTHYRLSQNVRKSKTSGRAGWKTVIIQTVNSNEVKASLGLR